MLQVGITVGVAALFITVVLYGLQRMAMRAVVYAAPSSQAVVTYTIQARAIGGSTETGRITNLEDAVERLNTQLEAQGASYRVELQGELTSESWADYKQRFVDDFNASQAPDIILSGHEDVAP